MIPIAQQTASTAQSTIGRTRAARIPEPSASCGTVTAASVTPSGCDICRMPIASPRRSFGNHPTTTRPLAAFVEALVMPPARNANPSSTGSPAASQAATTASVVSTRPPAMTTRSPNRSVIAPQAMSVRTMPKVGAAARTPATGRDVPRLSRWGMRSAGADTTSVPAAWAATPRASIVQARAETGDVVVDRCGASVVGMGRLGRSSSFRRGTVWYTRTVYHSRRHAARLVRRDRHDRRRARVADGPALRQPARSHPDPRHRTGGAHLGARPRHGSTLRARRSAPHCRGSSARDSSCTRVVRGRSPRSTSTRSPRSPRLRGILEAAAVRLAVQRATPEQLAEVRGHLDALQPTPDQQAGIRMGSTFHLDLAALGGNRFVTDAIADALTRLERTRWIEVRTPEARDAAWDEHSAIIDAVRDGDADRAAELVAAHVAGTNDRLLSWIAQERRRLRGAGMTIVGATER